MMKQTTFGVALIAILLLATAGSIGYALSLSSQTTIHDNTLEDKYIIIKTTDGDYTDFLDVAGFDTVNDDGTVTYTPDMDTDFNNDGINDHSKISKDLMIKVESENPQDTSGTFNLEVTVSGFSEVSGLTYTMVIGGDFANASDYTAGKWTFAELTLNTAYSVALYISGSATNYPGNNVGFTNYDGTTVPSTAGSVFTFIATANA